MTTSQLDFSQIMTSTGTGRHFYKVESRAVGTLAWRPYSNGYVRQDSAYDVLRTEAPRNWDGIEFRVVGTDGYVGNSRRGELHVD